MRRLRPHAIDFDDREPGAAPQFRQRRIPHVEPAKMEIRNIARYGLDPCRQRRRDFRLAIGENAAFAMIAREHQLHRLAGLRNLLQPPRQPAQIQRFQPCMPRVRRDQLAQRRPPGAGHHRRIFQRQRRNPPAGFIRPPYIKNTRLTRLRRERLQHQPGAARKRRQRRRQRRLVAHQAHAGAVAADIRLHHQRQAQPGRPHGVVCARHIVLPHHHGGGPRHEFRGLGAGQCQDRRFLLAAQPARGDAGIGGGRQTEIAMPQPQRHPLRNDGPIRHPARQKFEPADCRRHMRGGLCCRGGIGQKTSVAHAASPSRNAAETPNDIVTVRPWVRRWVPPSGRPAWPRTGPPA